MTIVNRFIFLPFRSLAYRNGKARQLILMILNAIENHSQLVQRENIALIQELQTILNVHIKKMDKHATALF